MPSGTTVIAADADVLPSPDGDECRVLVHGLRSRDIREGLLLSFERQHDTDQEGVK